MSGVGGGSAGTNQQWKAPSATNQQKYSLVPLPVDFEPTKEETSLLNFYETIRSYERQAARLKDAAARAKLAAKDAEFQKQNKDVSNPESATKKKKKKRKKQPTAAGDDEMAVESEDESSESEGSMDEDDDEHKSSYDRREEKLQALRDEVEAKINAAADAEAEQDALIQEHLTTSTTTEGPSIKRKKIEPAQKSSLIASIGNRATPPHDFSKKLELNPIHGKFLPDILICVI
jgi:hypothetical protein